MNNRWIGIPSGLKDELGQETARLGGIGRRVISALAASGFTQIQTPVLEYYDLFIHAGLPLPQEAILKTEDRAGRMCVMRPDSTIPAARVAATKLRGDERPLKLSYEQPVFRVQPDGKIAKYAQAGIEYIGAGGSDTDIEVLRLLLGTLRGIGLETLHLEIGHAGLIRAFLPELGLSEDSQADLLHAFERRNFAVVGDILAQCGSREEAEGLYNLVMLSGAGDCGGGTKPIQNARARRILDELNALIRALSGEDAALDCAMVSRMDYYTGLIFRVYAPGASREIAVGGRYDALMEKFGQAEPAIGFVLDIDALSGLEAVCHE
ncbi:MAG: ATP phosphoribosyltransferase regulatory subunit [Oscillospiraceae bacterium]|nr:ATP phosphoribosyltransferase regulatory subunit [Oscillospiraceae bacterium]